MSDTPHSALKWVMRCGYAARGIIYFLIGGLAFWASFSSMSSSGTEDTLSALRAQPMGVPALWAIGLGLIAYLVWRVTAGIADVEDHGTGPKGLIARGGQIVTGLIHGGIGLSVIGLAYAGSDQGGSAAQDWTARLMAMPAGRYLVALAAVILVGAGIYYMQKGWRGSYKSHLARSQFTQKVDPVLTAGLIIYGLMLALVALSLGFAALNADPSQAGGLGQALDQLRSAYLGRFLLAGAGLGLVAFALYNMVEAGWRVVPKLSAPDIRTLAS
ncbi:DUF1206 domain-containing protein [Sulfitobacter mediterraneus]|uniref:DUF1206 domain-containing protein n=1 Tax=Sulfitobacter mediterraneus TaxID=83219 RepID=UPI0021A25DF7|nr:DUF1206 domain-containing protein [Sulfitobacter mediterraneus]